MEREQEDMPDYKKMYFSLLNTVSSTIEHLQAAQCNMENEYIEHTEPLLHIVSDSKEEKTKAAEQSAAEKWMPIRREIIR